MTLTQPLGDSIRPTRPNARRPRANASATTSTATSGSAATTVREAAKAQPLNPNQASNDSSSTERCPTTPIKTRSVSFA